MKRIVSGVVIFTYLSGFAISPSSLYKHESHNMVPNLGSSSVQSQKQLDAYLDQSQVQILSQFEQDLLMQEQEKQNGVVFEIKGSMPAQIGIQQYDVADQQQLQQLLAQIPYSSTKDIIVTTDSLKATETIMEFSDSRLDLKKPQYIFYGDILADNGENIVGKNLNADFQYYVQRPLQKFRDKAVDAIFSDKIGLMLTVVNTAYDSYIWIHAEQYSLSQRSAIVFMNLFMAITFGLDKDMWTKVTRPIQQTLASTLKQFGIVESYTRQIGTKFFANLSLSLGIQMARMSIISLDNLYQSLSTPEFWLTTVGIGSLLTFAQFSWSEQLADIDQIKNPVAKNIMRRFAEIRYIILGNVAASSKLYQTDVYGLTPIVSLVIAGSAGVISLFNSDKIVQQIEKSHYLNVLHQQFLKLDQAISHIFFKPLRSQCRHLLRSL